MSFIQDHILDKKIANERVKDLKIKLAIIEIPLIVIMVLMCFTTRINLEMTFNEYINNTSIIELLIQIFFYLCSIAITLISFSLNFWDTDLQSYAEKEDSVRDGYTESKEPNVVINKGGRDLDI
jgi:uncharacterized membrane protein YGL010W